MSADPRPTLAAPDDDPRLWLEEIEGERALAWVEAQNARTIAAFGDARFAADRDTLAAIYDRNDNIPFVSRRGPYLYNFWRDADHPRGLWRRSTAESYRTPNPEWEIVLDLDALGKAENEDWVWRGAATLPSEHKRAFVRLSRGGSDAIVLREFDLASGTFVPDGFTLPEAKGDARWLDADTLLLASAYGDGMATQSGYSRTVRLWRRGCDVANAPIVFETTPDKMGAFGQLDRTSPTEMIWFTELLDFFDVSLWIGNRNGPMAKLDLPTDVETDSHGGWLTVKRRTAWTIGGVTHPPDTLLGMSLDAFLAGNRNFAVLFETGKRRTLQNSFWSAGRLILSILHDLQTVFEVLTPSPAGWSRSKLSGLPETGVVHVRLLDIEESESNGDLVATVEDPLTPSSFLLLEPSKAPLLLKQAPKTFTADGLVVTRHEALSVDGERIPYVQVGPANETGDAPVHLYGYGGFAESMLPQYNGGIGKLWLERGGTSVIANIRGGGEFGARWHEAGRRAGKRLSHDDFAAVAADLIRRGVTQPRRIAAEGGSNGGILITNMLVRYPELFGALFCTIPLIDMRRYNKLLAGASWVAEYGDPDKPEDWAYLQTYSAYHLAEAGRVYPPILFATTRKDDRVHPGHARKMAEKLQSLGYDAWFHEPAAGGHGHKDNSEFAAFYALGLTFLRKKIGWDDEV